MSVTKFHPIYLDFPNLNEVALFIMYKITCLAELKNRNNYDMGTSDLYV